MRSYSDAIKTLFSLWFQSGTRIEFLVIDVDGVLTNGQSWYSKEGKILKAFGSHDADALQLIRDIIEIRFVSADHRGFDISQSRVNDMGFSLQLANSEARLELIRKLLTRGGVAFIGDSFTDKEALQAATISFAPRNGHPIARKAATIVLKADGGQGAVAEAVLILQRSLRK